MPLQVIESTDPVASLMHFRTSTVYEMMISLQALLKPGARTEWAAGAHARLSPGLLDELAEVYGPFGNGSLFFELGVDYLEHHDVVGFVRYVRQLDPVMFMFYVVGRIITPQEIERSGLTYEGLSGALGRSPYESHCLCTSVPLQIILNDVPAFQNRLADLWQRYWDEYFADEVDRLPEPWEAALNDKHNLLNRLGGMGMYEHVTGKTELMPPLPADHPVTEIVFIPLSLIPFPVYMFYGYGNITVLFDSERTEARIAQLEQQKTQIVDLLKALGDSSRLDILRLVAQYGEMMNGKKIAHKLNLSASAVSRHLAQLKDAGLILEETQDNRTISYRLQEQALTALPVLLREYLQH